MAHQVSPRAGIKVTRCRVLAHGLTSFVPAWCIWGLCGLWRHHEMGLNLTLNGTHWLMLNNAQKFPNLSELLDLPHGASRKAGTTTGKTLGRGCRSASCVALVRYRTRRNAIFLLSWIPACDREVVTLAVRLSDLPSRRTLGKKKVISEQNRDSCAGLFF